MIDINLVNRKLVKPFTPTPQNLKNYKLSLIDELIQQLDSDVGVVLFYASEGKRIIDLEESLSKVLVQFYPLAGRYVRKDGCVDCSDQGAEFLEAQAPDVELATLIVERDLKNLAGLFPRKNHQVDEASYPLLSIQITQLKCGGVVIGISISHKIFDASSMGTFVAAWSSASKDGNTAITPILNSSPLLNPFKNRNNYLDSGMIHSLADAPRVCVKRFTFNKEAISRLRSKLRPKEGARGWSRVRVVHPFIAKALIRVDRAKHGAATRPYFHIAQAINIRERTIPPLPNHSCGNLVLASHLRYMDMGFHELADLMSEAIDKGIADCSQILSLGEDGLNKLIAEPTMKAFAAWRSGEANLMVFTDWSKFGFYEADFGWGKPVWASILPLGAGNGAVLMENKELGGIEAWVHLDTNGMALFEQDEEIRLFAT